MKKITNKWLLFLYGFAGMGVNMLNLMVTSYMLDGIQATGYILPDRASWTFEGKCLIVAAAWSIMILIAKIVDGVIDVPFASFTDNLRTKWGKRRPAIVIGFVPMIIFYVLLMFPIVNQENNMANTIYLGIMLCLFYSFYTLTMVTYYATFSEITDNDRDRVHLSNYKTIFDVVYFVLGYALIPVLLDASNLRTICMLCIPLSLTMLIPLFLIKEKSTLLKDKEQNDDTKKEENVKLFASLKYSFKNKPFIIWMIIYALLQFGLQLFLTGQSVFYTSSMGLAGIEITAVMACAFAPVPFTLIIYNKLVQKYGVRFGYLFSAATYVISMIIMFFAQDMFITDKTIKIIMACFGAIISSFGTGCFFSVNYVIPSTLADLELKEKGISHPAMFFAVQGLAGGIATGITTGPIWSYLIKENNIVWSMPLFVIAFCVVSMIATKFLPKELSDIGRNK